MLASCKVDLDGICTVLNRHILPYKLNCVLPLYLFHFCKNDEYITEKISLSIRQKCIRIKLHLVDHCRSRLEIIGSVV